eukprot:6280980-Ditylum_brightwellii.AAC.1
MPPTEAAQHLEWNKKYDYPPVMPLLDNKSQKDKINAKRNNYKCRLTFLALDKKGVKPRNKFTVLLSLLMQLWPNTSLQTWSDKVTLQEITTRVDLLHMQDELVVYCSHIKRKHHLEAH